uniref:HTH psq-type domain-containing protein n=1 Tax=Trichuris muris TaxID=70415 RepID=A0A5S6QS86_TRIMR
MHLMEMSPNGMKLNTSMNRKRVVLTLKDKRGIIDALNKGESGRFLAEKYGVGASTICDIKKKSESIMCFFKDLTEGDGSPERKAMKKPQNEEVDQAVVYAETFHGATNIRSSTL